MTDLAERRSKGVLRAGRFDTAPSPPARVVRFALPTPALRSHVERIWSWEAPVGASLPLVLPGTGAELFLHLATPFAWEEDGVRTPLAEAHLLGLRSRTARLVAPGPVRFVAVRFRAGALRHFSVAPPDALDDRFAPAREAFGPGADALLSEVLAADGFEDQVRRVELALLRRLAARGARPGGADAAVARLYYRAGQERISDTAQALGLTARQLQRLTQAAVGLAPKRFQRLARFQHVMRHLHLARRRDYLDVALAHGFFDQAHFVHDVRALTGSTPGQLLTPARFLSHFYNPRLPSLGHAAPREPGEERNHGDVAGRADVEGGG